MSQARWPRKIRDLRRAGADWIQFEFSPNALVPSFAFQAFSTPMTLFLVMVLGSVPTAPLCDSERSGWFHLDSSVTPVRARAQMKKREDAERFAEAWIAAWNRREVESVLDMYSDELFFTSPTALAVTGQATIKGKAALRGYWQAALGRIERLHFTLDRIIWDDESNELGIIYTRDVDGGLKQAVETFRFDASGLVVATDVFHGLVSD